MFKVKLCLEEFKATLVLAHVDEEDDLCQCQPASKTGYIQQIGNAKNKCRPEMWKMEDVLQGFFFV